MATPAQLAQLSALVAAQAATLAQLEPVVAAPPPNPEDPTPAEIENVSDMLDEANGKLGIIRAVANDTATTPQEKIASILQTLGETP